MKELKDLIPIRVTNSESKQDWLNAIYRSASTDDGRAIVAAIALLIGEIGDLQQVVGSLNDE